MAVKLCSLLTLDKWDATYAALQKASSADFIAVCATVGLNAVVAQAFYDCLIIFVQGTVIGGWA